MSQEGRGRLWLQQGGPAACSAPAEGKAALDTHPRLTLWLLEEPGQLETVPASLGGAPHLYNVFSLAFTLDKGLLSEQEEF